VQLWGNPMRHYTHAAFSDASLAGHPTQHIRPTNYNKIIDDLASPDGSSGTRADLNGDGLSDVGAMYDCPGERSVLFVWIAKSGWWFQLAGELVGLWP
jgi:hypothetical protein